MTANTSAPKPRKPRPKLARTAQLHIRPEGDAPGAVELAVGKASAAYLITEIPADCGRGFAVEKITDGTAYAVNIDADRRSCECKGFLHHGHCKHGDGLAALIAAGRL
jgi:hypothetical protein